jgi:hypothetical protein
MIMMDKKKIASLALGDYSPNKKQEKPEMGMKEACVDIAKQMIQAFKEENAEKLSDLLKQHAIIVDKTLDEEEEIEEMGG